MKKYIIRKIDGFVDSQTEDNSGQFIEIKNLIDCQLS